jgi:hypothetical protein
MGKPGRNGAVRAAMEGVEPEYTHGVVAKYHSCCRNAAQAANCFSARIIAYIASIMLFLTMLVCWAGCRPKANYTRL